MSVDVEVEWRGLDRFVRAMQRAPQGIRYAASIAVDQVGYLAERRAKALAPVRTGRLRSSIRFEKRGELEGALISDVPYAKYQEFGTRRIQPRHFMTEAMRGTGRLLREVFIEKFEEWLRSRGE